MPTNPNDIIRVVCGYTYLAGGKPMSNVFHFADTGVGGVVDADLLVGMGLTIEAIFDSMPPLQSEDLIFTEYSVANITQDTIIGTLPWPTFTVGENLNPIDVSQVVALLRMPTPQSRVQGRVNIVGMTEAGIEDGIFMAGVLSAVLLVGIQLLLTYVIAPSDFTYVVFNQVFKTFNLPNSAALGTATRTLGRRRLA